MVAAERLPAPRTSAERDEQDARRWVVLQAAFAVAVALAWVALEIIFLGQTSQEARMILALSIAGLAGGGALHRWRQLAARRDAKLLEHQRIIAADEIRRTLPHAPRDRVEQLVAVTQLALNEGQEGEL